MVALWIVATAAAAVVAFRGELSRAWKEPVLAVPILIIESDDWGFGPGEQAERLRDIAALLARHRDDEGRPAVMTLGVVLAGPDTTRTRAEGGPGYVRLALDAPELQGVRSAMLDGRGHGVFALQLHGMEHFWPPALLEAARTDSSVHGWLTGPGVPPTEVLPSHLQSRWIDASRLPSKDLPASEALGATSEEASAFKRIFGAAPEVVVPPTFVWTPDVEAGWFSAGVRVLVTPGRRYEGRDSHGRPIRASGAIHNGERAASGLTYVVRDDYFEPALGHGAARGLDALQAKTRLGRPALLETHRANFLGAHAARSLEELDRLLAAAKAAFPALRFMSTAELASHYRQRSALVEQRLGPRLHCILSRLARCSRLRMLAWASGLAIPAGLVWLATRATRSTSRRPAPTV